MAYLHCARCGLQIKIQAQFLHIDNCPRCLARTATMSPMTLSGSVSPTAARDAEALDRTGDQPDPFVLSLIHSDQRPDRHQSISATAIDVAADESDVRRRRTATTRRAHQGALAAAVRAMRSHQRPRDSG